MRLGLGRLVCLGGLGRSGMEIGGDGLIGSITHATTLRDEA